MGKVIIITERQLREDLGIDASYFDEDNLEHNGYNADIEVFTGGKTSDKKEALPFTTDEFANHLAPNAGWMKNRVNNSLPINCSAKGGEILDEANEAGKNREWNIPDDLYGTLQQNARNYTGDKNASGYDRLNNLINKRNVGYDEMRRLKNFFDNKAKKEIEHANLIGGDKMKQWVDNSLKSFTDSVAGDKANRSSMGMENVYQKPGGSRDFGNGQAHTPKNNNTFNGEVTTF